MSRLYIGTLDPHMLYHLTVYVMWKKTRFSFPCIINGIDTLNAIWCPEAVHILKAVKRVPFFLLLCFDVCWIQHGTQWDEMEKKQDGEREEGASIWFVFCLVMGISHQQWTCMCGALVDTFPEYRVWRWKLLSICPENVGPSGLCSPSDAPTTCRSAPLGWWNALSQQQRCSFKERPQCENPNRSRVYLSLSLSHTHTSRDISGQS